ncbi:MAG: VOC family protein [Parvularculaceae bacterium]|nr:VOC family protein [Parvularculaceae bacterium]
MARSPKKSTAQVKKKKKPAAKKAAPKPPSKRAKLSAKEYAPLAPYLRIKGAREAIDFYKKAFNASVRMIMDAEDKVRIMHADLIINGGEIMLSDTFPEFGTAVTTPPVDANTTTVSLHLQVNDADKWWKRATDAGCSVVMPLEDQFWGDRFGMIKDPFGHVWSIASRIKKKRAKKRARK